MQLKTLQTETPFKDGKLPEVSSPQNSLSTLVMLSRNHHLRTSHRAAETVQKLDFAKKSLGDVDFAKM